MYKRPKSSLPPEAQPWARTVGRELDIAERAVEQNDLRTKNTMKSVNATIKQLSRQIETMQDIIDNMPYHVTTGTSATNFAATGSGWITVATVTVPTPTGYQTGEFTVQANLGVLDASTAGLTSCLGRIVIGGSTSPSFFPAKDHGASSVLNVLTMNWHLSRDAVGNSTTITVQVDPLNDAAFPANASNYAVVTVNGILYRS